MGGDQIIYDTGLVVWCALGIAALALVGEWSLQKLIYCFWAKKELMAFVWDRLTERRRQIMKKRATQQPPSQ